jgi:hypothetical protein
LDEHDFRFRGDRVGDQPAADGQSLVARIKQTRLGQSAPDEDRRRLRYPVKGGWCCTPHIDLHAVRNGVGSDPLAPLLVALERDSVAAVSATAPFNRDAARS